MTLASVRQLPGITEVAGDLGARTLVVTYDPASVEPEEIVQAIQQAGFDVMGTFEP